MFAKHSYCFRFRGGGGGGYRGDEFRGDWRGGRGGSFRGGFRTDRGRFVGRSRGNFQRGFSGPSKFYLVFASYNFEYFLKVLFIISSYCMFLIWVE